MRSSRPSTVRLTTPAMQRMLFAASVLVFISGFQLFVLSEFTDRFFAWTIDPPLTAAFLGAAYWASFAMEFFASRKSQWVHARIAVPAVLIFTSLTLIVTLLHLDRFHLNHPNFITRGAAWAWLLVYAIVPIVMAIVLYQQLQMPGGDLPRQTSLPVWVRSVLAVHAIIMIPIGLGLLFVPEIILGAWPWTLTPLTARAIGAWSLALGIAAAHSIWENDWARVHIATVSYTVFSVFELIALVRYPSQVNWSNPAAWFYVIFLISVLIVGLYGWRESVRHASLSDPAAAQSNIGR